MTAKEEFKSQLKEFVKGLQEHISTKDGQWTVKGFIDVYQNIYTISSDTKIVSKILEIHIFPKMLWFAHEYGYKVVLAEHQNHYPDISFVKSDDELIRFAVDFKTTYLDPKKSYLCNGFTLGSYGKYFQDRTSTKNIRFPYRSYTGHFCIGIIYDRVRDSAISETKPHKLEELQSLSSVAKNFQFSVSEKWKIASDKAGSGNTANIGSIKKIEDIANENGMFSRLGEDWFDDYWMNFKKITIPDGTGKTKKISNLKEFVEYRRGDVSLIVPKNNRALGKE